MKKKILISSVILIILGLFFSFSRLVWTALALIALLLSLIILSFWLWRHRQLAWLKLVALTLIMLSIFGFLQYQIGITRIDDEIRARLLVYSNKETEVDMKVVNRLLTPATSYRYGFMMPVLSTANSKHGRIYAVSEGLASDFPTLYYNYKGDFMASCNGAVADHLRLPICDAGFMVVDEREVEYFSSMESKRNVCLLRVSQGWSDPECFSAEYFKSAEYKRNICSIRRKQGQSDSECLDTVDLKN